MSSAKCGQFRSGLNILEKEMCQNIHGNACPAINVERKNSETTATYFDHFHIYDLYRFLPKCNNNC